MNIKHAFSTAYHHETVGTIERSHRVLNEYLRTYINEQQTDWDEYMKYFAYCHNVTPHVGFNLRFTPFELVFGKIPSIPEFCLKEKIEPVYNFESYIKEFKYNLHTMHKQAQNLLLCSKIRNKYFHDRKVKRTSFQKGDKVLIKKEDRRKLDAVYNGPFIIKHIDGLNVTVIDENKKEKTIHKNNIVKY